MTRPLSGGSLRACESTPQRGGGAHDGREGAGGPARVSEVNLECIWWRGRAVAWWGCGPTEPTGPQLLQQCRLVERILTAWEENDRVQ